MRASHGLALASTLLAGVAIGFIAAPVRGAPDPVEDIAGDYAGKLTSRTQVIDAASEEPGKETILATGTFTQDEFDFNGTLVVDDEDDSSFNLTGRIGNGRFQGVAEDGEGTLVLFGTIKGKPGKRTIKAKGVFLAGSHYSEVSVTLKESLP